MNKYQKYSEVREHYPNEHNTCFHVLEQAKLCWEKLLEK